jgi:hypothetical protein
MDDYVVVRQPNNHIVLGVNDDRPEHVYIVQFDERYESCYPSGNQIMAIVTIVLLLLTAASIHV